MKLNPTKTINELITALSYATDIEGHKKIYHAWGVAILSARIAQEGLLRELKNIFYASLLHDIGGVGFPFHIIHYLSRNDKTSRNILLSHPIVGAQLTADIPGLSASAKIILDHHEWLNGQGYPRAKLKNNIPLGSQVIRVADSVDIALQTNRFIKLKDLKKQMSLNIDKEYTKKLFFRTFDTLRENNFFDKICQPRNVPAMLKEIKDRVGFIHIPSKIDAIGDVLEIVAQISDMKHPYTYGHSLRVSRFAMAIALAMHLDHDEVTMIKWAGLVHDIGKISVSRRILDKPRSLNSEELKKIKKHADITQEIMAMIPTLKEVMPLASGHHEYFDGSGYPQGLRNKEIPLGAKIVTICDAFDAMTSNRPYRDALSSKFACQEIEKFSGKQFDPEVVEEAIPIFKNLGL